MYIVGIVEQVDETRDANDGEWLSAEESKDNRRQRAGCEEIGFLINILNDNRGLVRWVAYQG